MISISFLPDLSQQKRFSPSPKHLKLNLFNFLTLSLVFSLHSSSGIMLSLSFFLALVCSMAPKCKSTPSQNPLHSRASTSSNPTPSHVWFRNDKARKDFLENFSRRGIHSECKVILSDFFDTDFPTVIYSQGWESLCGIPITCPSVIIQEFYSNMHGFDF